MGTGTPAAASNFLVSSLSWAMASAMALVIHFGGLDAALLAPAKAHHAALGHAAEGCCGPRRRPRCSQCWAPIARLHPVPAAARGSAKDRKRVVHGGLAKACASSSAVDPRAPGCTPPPVGTSGIDGGCAAAEGNRAPPAPAVPAPRVPGHGPEGWSRHGQWAGRGQFRETGPHAGFRIRQSCRRSARLPRETMD